MQKAYIFLKTTFSLVANKITYAPSNTGRKQRIILLEVIPHTVRFLAIELSEGEKAFIASDKRVFGKNRCYSQSL